MEDTTTMQAKQLGFEDVEWIQLAHGWVQWRAPYNHANDIFVPIIKGEWFLY